MSRNMLRQLILSCLAVFFVTGCESLQPQNKNKVDPFSGARMDAGSVTPLPSASSTPLAPAQKKSEPVQSSSVEIFDMELNRGYQRGVVPPMATQQRMPAPAPLIYAEEFGTSDSSVTIFGLDDALPHMAAQPYGNIYPPVNAVARTSLGQAAGQIFFKHGSSRLGSGDLRKISSLADQARFAPVNYVTVSGHASKPTQAGRDTERAHIINLRQSIKRSEKVTKALIKKGVPAEKLKTVSWGSAKATGKNAHDRRVDVVMGEQ